MDYIHAEHLQRYEKILQKIDQQQAACQQLEKDVKLENDKIVAANIATQDIKDKLFKIHVRVFDSIVEVLDYNSSLSTTAQQFLCHPNIKFYLIEVYVSTVFQDKLAAQRWLLNVKIKSPERTMCQSLNLKRQAFTYPLAILLPFDGLEKNCVVETSLMLPSKGFWSSIVLDTIHVDISYHFKINKLAVLSEPKPSNVLNVCGCYNKDSSILQNLRSQRIREIRLLCNESVSTFLKKLTLRCYHRVDCEMVSELTKLETLTYLEIATDNTAYNKAVICFNPKEKILKIKATPQIIYDLKKFFIKESSLEKCALDEEVIRIHEVCLSLFEING